MDPLVYILDFIVLIGIFSIFSLSLNIEFGFAGLANFGKVAFVLVGAYTYTLLSNINAPFYLEGYECSVGISIGISLYPIDGSNIELLLSNADSAMFCAKRKGRNTYQFFRKSNKIKGKRSEKKQKYC